MAGAGREAVGAQVPRPLSLTIPGRPGGTLGQCPPPGAVEGGLTSPEAGGLFGAINRWQGQFSPEVSAGGQAGLGRAPEGKVVAVFLWLPAASLPCSALSVCGFVSVMPACSNFVIQPSDFPCSEQTKPNLVRDVLSRNSDGWRGLRCGGWLHTGSPFSRYEDRQRLVL